MQAVKKPALPVGATAGLLVLLAHVTAAHAAEAPHAGAIKPSGPPYPPSPIIQAITWAPRAEIIRRAKGSDNWPMTWADDDALYGAYGDGNGFEPFVLTKLSVGFARVTLKRCFSAAIWV